MTLVVTIIVLIILATVSISAVLGENGIIKKAKLSKEMHENKIIADEEEMNKLLEEYANAMEGEGAVREEATNEEGGGSTVVTTYSIIYNLAGGTLGNDVIRSYNIETETFNLPIPTKTNYTFKGWYTSSDFSGTAVTQIVKGSTGDRYYYAKWEILNTIPTFTYTGEYEIVDDDGNTITASTGNWKIRFLRVSD